MFQPGDYVYPKDLPLRLLCRVTQAESLNPGGEGFQVLNLTPLQGPWRAGPQLVRFAEGVRLARRMAARGVSPASGGINRRRPRGRRWQGFLVQRVRAWWPITWGWIPRGRRGGVARR